MFLNTPKGLLTFKTKLGKIHVRQTQKLRGSKEVKQQDVRQSDVPWCCSLKTQQVVDIYHSHPLHKYKLKVRFGSTQTVKRQKAVNLLFIQEHYQTRKKTLRLSNNPVPGVLLEKCIIPLQISMSLYRHKTLAQLKVLHCSYAFSC